MNSITTLIQRYFPAPPVPPLVYHPTDATIAALCTCLSYHKERNAQGFAYTFQELSGIANRQLLTSCDSEWVSLMRIIETEAKNGVRYRVTGYDDEECLVAERIAPGSVQTTDTLTERVSMVDAGAKRIVYGACFVIVCVLMVVLRH